MYRDGKIVKLLYAQGPFHKVRHEFRNSKSFLCNRTHHSEIKNS